MRSARGFAESEFEDDDIRLLLDARDRVLRKLALLSNASAMRLIERVSSGKAEHRPPPGSNPERGPGPPDIDESPYDHFVWQFERAASDPDRIQALVFIASRVHREIKFGARARESSEERSTRIIREYEGWREIEVAVYERISVAHVRKLRSDSERDPKTGRRWEDAPRPAPALGAASHLRAV